MVWAQPWPLKSAEAKQRVSPHAVSCSEGSTATPVFPSSENPSFSSEYPEWAATVQLSPPSVDLSKVPGS